MFLLSSLSLSVEGLKCYTDVAGKQITTCKETEGYRTCFTKYNDSKSKLQRDTNCREVAVNYRFRGPTLG